MFLTKLLFPSRCPFCTKVIEQNSRSCKDCAKYLELAAHKQRLPNNCECLSVFRHEGVWRNAVLNYKFRSNRQYYVQFSLILGDALERNYNTERFDFYTFVPMHKNKLRERGFNQVELLCKETARLTSACSKSVLKQTKINKTQHELNREDRKANVKGIYSCTDERAVKDKNILLFDDIVTTGFTLSECSNILLKSGAKEVVCITLNRS